MISLCLPACLPVTCHFCRPSTPLPVDDVCVCVCATLLCCGPHSFARPCALRFWRPAILCGRSVAAKRIWAAKVRCGGRGAARVWRAQSRPPKREEEEEAKPRLLRATRAAPPHCATPWEPTLPDGKVLRWLACAVACLIRSRPPRTPSNPSSRGVLCCESKHRSVLSLASSRC